MNRHNKRGQGKFSKSSCELGRAFGTQEPRTRLSVAVIGRQAKTGVEKLDVKQTILLATTKFGPFRLTALVGSSLALSFRSRHICGNATCELVKNDPIAVVFI